MILPVSDVDRAKAFYVDKVGFVVDHDVTVSEAIRFVQLTPPGSACSIAFGLGLTEAAPGSVRGMQIVVENAQRAYDELSARGVDVERRRRLGLGTLRHLRPPRRQTGGRCRSCRRAAEPGRGSGERGVGRGLDLPVRARQLR